MENEIWFDKEYSVHKFERGSCMKCSFYNTGSCIDVVCDSTNRYDSKDVFFVKVDDERKPQPDAQTSQNWEGFAAQGQRDIEYYRGVLDQIGDLLGIAAYTSDDGSIQDSVLCVKLPELVAKLVYENVTLKSRINSLEVLGQ
jgi:hypothetical protein